MTVKGSPRVALVGEQWVTDRPGGLNRYLADLHASTRDGGLDATAFVLGEGALPDGVIGVASPTASGPARIAGMRRSVKRAGPFDVIDVHFAAFAGGLVAPPTRPGVVVHFQGPWAAESAAAGAGGRTVAVRRAVERFVYRRGDAFVTLSAAFADVLVDGYGVRRDRVHVIPPGVDTGRFHDGGPDGRHRARARFGIAPDAFVVVCVRRLVPRMGIDVLLDAWPRVMDGTPSAQLIVVGDGPEAAALQAGAPRPGVRFAGRVDDDELVDWYRAADLGVVPSVALEGFGLVVLESLACGRPVVATDVGGLPEAVGSFGADLLVPAGDARALGAVLAEVASGARVVPDAGACRSVAVERSWPAVAARHVELYRTVAEGRR